MVKIAHIADTHIRNLKYHEEYRAAFSNMYEILREQEACAWRAPSVPTRLAEKIS